MMDELEAQIANCAICTLSVKMRECKRCAFNAGIVAKLLKEAFQVPAPTVGELTDAAYMQGDYGTHVIISGGEVLELSAACETRTEEAMLF